MKTTSQTIAQLIADFQLAIKRSNDTYKAMLALLKPLALRGNVRDSVITILLDGKAYTGGTTGSGKWSKAYRNGQYVAAALRKLGLECGIGHDAARAPKGGAVGEFVVCTNRLSIDAIDTHIMAAAVLELKEKALSEAIESLRTEIRQDMVSYSIHANAAIQLNSDIRARVQLLIDAKIYTSIKSFLKTI